ncbi:response regulator [Poseidonocella sp. HB161398]|uniref:response regulator n=1 Tax=Poseidonocella sp. HB161398 TaxID=2320855 RepID=UPI001109B629|nr:response regulator [Poseidonocella sp. HB161398]
MDKARPRLLIADDNHEFAAYIGRAAEGAGWTVTSCADGGALLDSAAGLDCPALLLVDIDMPGLDGIQAAGQLARLENAALFRLRFVTGGAETGPLTARMIAEAGSIATGRSLFKPVRRMELLEILEHEHHVLDSLAEERGAG